MLLQPPLLSLSVNTKLDRAIPPYQLVAARGLSAGSPLKKLSLRHESNNGECDGIEEIPHLSTLTLLTYNVGHLGAIARV